jgi:ABC-2 type transport system ATP-binding protein
MQKVLEVIRKDVAEDLIRVDNPTQNLENYFLDVVKKARQQEAQTSGATSGNRVAEYLRGQADAPESRTERVLERFTSPVAPQPVEEPNVALGNPPKVDVRKLEQLAPTKEENIQPVSSAGAANPEELRKANEKLSNLLGRKS